MDISQNKIYNNYMKKAVQLGTTYILYWDANKFWNKVKNL